MRGEDTMDPLIKFIGAIILLLAAAALPLEYSPFLLALLFCIALINRVPLREFALGCAGLALFIALFNIAAFGGLERAALNALHIVSMMMPFYLFAKTSSPHDMMEGMRRAGVPHDFSFVFSTSLPFSGVVRKKAQAVRIAQESRGGRDIWALTVPVFHSIFQKAQNLAVSIESRGGIGKEN